MVMGLLFHYVIAFSFTFLFFLLYSRIRILSRSVIVTGIVYGIFVSSVMNLVIVQLSNAPHASIKDMKPEKILKATTILIVMIGLPLSFIAKKYLSNNSGKIVRKARA